MLATALGIAILGMIILLSVRVKVRNNYYRAQVTDPISSPISEALGQLLAIAGGVYLSLVMLVSFLGMTSPEKIYIYSMQLDPLALISFIIAIIQPFLIHWTRKIIK